MGPIVIMWSECYDVEQMLSCGSLCYYVDEMLSCRRRCYFMDNFKLEEVSMNTFNVIIWCSHLVSSCDVIMLVDNTPFLVIPEI
jgi:hypothetical protein